MQAFTQHLLSVGENVGVKNILIANIFGQPKNSVKKRTNAFFIRPDEDAALCQPNSSIFGSEKRKL